MTSFPKLLATDPKEDPSKSRAVFLCVFGSIMSLIFILWAIASFNRASENLQDLTHVTGNLKGHRIIKHKTRNGRVTYYEDILVIRINNCDDEFGFGKHREFYSKLSNTITRQTPPTFEIYYDKTRKRIDQNVTLHIFDLTINGEKYLSIAEVKNADFIGAIILSTMALITLAFTYLGLRFLLQKGLVS